MSLRRHTQALLLILATALFCYANTFHVPFILDDITSIVTNSRVQSLSITLKTRMIGDVSFGLNFLLHGLWLPGYHLVNLLLHIVNGLLAYLLVVTVFRTPLLNQDKVDLKVYSFALFTALIFVAHPLQTQAVTYLAQRVTLLAACFSLLTLLFYLKLRMALSVRASAGFFVLSALFMVAALLSKENAVAVPVLLFLVETTFFRGRTRPFLPLLYLLPLFMFIAAVFLIPSAGGGIWRAMLAFSAEQGAAPRLNYLLSQFPVIVDYLRLFIVPFGQSLDHDPLLRFSIFEPAVLLSWLFLAAFATAGVLLLRSRNPLPVMAGFGILWFFCAIWVESGAVPLKDLMAEQRMYLPSIGLCLVTASASLQFFTQRQFKLFASVVLLTLASLTISRNAVWQSEIALWEDVTVKSPKKGRGYGALGHAYQRSGFADRAEAAYRRAIELSPRDHIARNNLGALYLAEKRYEEAVQEFSEGQRLSGASPVIHFNMGLACAGLGRYRDAEASFAEALRLKPDYRQAEENLVKMRSLRVQSR